jgi:DNA-binding beta-propeller fold protein YncE
MRIVNTLGLFITIGSLTASGAPQGRQAPPAPPCTPSGNPQYVCGQQSPEDLVLVPGGDWVLATSFGGSGGVKLINVHDKTTTTAYPSATVKEQLDAKTYDTCPGPPDAEDKARFTTHGIALTPGRNNRHTLWVVHHGKRESIEVFEVNAREKAPSLTWIGCAVAPDPVGLNSVVGLTEGGFITTNFLARGGDPNGRAKMQAGEPNGELWEWHTKSGWKKVPGSEASGPNGVEISKDGKTIYMALWGSQEFARISRGQTPVKRDVIPLGFRVDNIRLAPDGKIFAAGQGGAGAMQTSNVVKIDPATLKIQEILRQPNDASFGAGTVAVQIGKEIWVGSFRGDRIAIFPVMP